MSSLAELGQIAKQAAYEGEPRRGVDPWNVAATGAGVGALGASTFSSGMNANTRALLRNGGKPQSKGFRRMAAGGAAIPVGVGLMGAGGALALRNRRNRMQQPVAAPQQTP